MRSLRAHRGAMAEPPDRRAWIAADREGARPGTAAPEGNGCAERVIRKLKENLLWVRTFETVEELRQALLTFRETYNTTWLIERHGFLTPDQCRQKQLQTAAIAA